MKNANFKVLRLNHSLFVDLEFFLEVMCKVCLWNFKNSYPSSSHIKLTQSIAT